MIGERSFDFNEVWGRIRKVTGWKRYGEFAEFLDIRSASVSGAKIRGAMPIEWALRVAQSRNISTDWLLTGAEPQSPFDTDFLVHVVQVFEKALQTRGTKLDWEIKGKLLGLVLNRTKKLGFDQDADIEKITIEYLDVIEVSRK
jgi:hypothetical protein